MTSVPPSLINSSRPSVVSTLMQSGGTLENPPVELFARAERILCFPALADIPIEDPQTGI